MKLCIIGLVLKGDIVWDKVVNVVVQYQFETKVVQSNFVLKSKCDKKYYIEDV